MSRIEHNENNTRTTFCVHVSTFREHTVFDTAQGFGIAASGQWSLYIRKLLDIWMGSFSALFALHTK